VTIVHPQLHAIILILLLLIILINRMRFLNDGDITPDMEFAMANRSSKLLHHFVSTD